jgi:hypothetical protein
LVETAAAVVFSLKRWRTAFSLKSGVLVYVQYLFFGGHFLMEWFVGEGLKEVVVGSLGVLRASLSDALGMTDFALGQTFDEAESRLDTRAEILFAVCA